MLAALTSCPRRGQQRCQWWSSPPRALAARLPPATSVQSVPCRSAPLQLVQTSLQRTRRTGCWILRWSLSTATWEVRLAVCAAPPLPLLPHSAALAPPPPRLFQLTPVLPMYLLSLPTCRSGRPRRQLGAAGGGPGVPPACPPPRWCARSSLVACRLPRAWRSSLVAGCRAVVRRAVPPGCQQCAAAAFAATTPVWSPASTACRHGAVTLLAAPLAPAGLVLCPGSTLPLRLTFRGDRALVQQALSAPPPLTRLIAVVCCQRSYFTPQLMLQR